jgi:predicted SAM-dependent methyltransferase
MRLLNLGCGAVRPPDPWVNVDTILAVHAAMPEAQAAPVRAQLAAEPNYVEHDIACLPWPWEDGSLNGILASHILEHFDCLTALALVRECRRVLAPGGVLRVSVPDAAYFRAVHVEDNAANAERLFGQPLYGGATMLDYAFFFIGHKQTFSEDSLWCLLVNGGFSPYDIKRGQPGYSIYGTEAAQRMAEQDNRLQMSLFMEATKEA